jgi:hypothetical protein
MIKMDTKFSPGPYKAIKATFNNHIWSRFITDVNGNIIAQISYANRVQSENEVIHTANLLASAPELLKLVQDFRMYRQNSKIMDRLIDEADRLIAKTEGRE